MSQGLPRPIRLHDQTATMRARPRPAAGARLFTAHAPLAALSRLAAHLGGLVLALSALALVSGLWSNHGLDARNPMIERELASQPIEPMPFEQAGQSFPGSAFYYVIDDEDLPAASPWFTAPSPALASPSGTLPETLALSPAHALIGLNNPVDFNRALTCLTQAIYYEAASEPDAGQRAVAQVVLNRLAHPAYPKTVCDVVYQGSERATGCQFTFTCDGALARKPVAWFWRRAESVAQAALKGAVYAPVGLATHYHTFAVHPVWADSLNFLDQIGAHRFYALTGPAGAAGAFRFVHSRPEPLPGPHPSLALQTAAYTLAEDPVALERSYASAAPVQHAPPPRYTEDMLRHGGDSAYRAQSLPASETIRPEYRNSGQWIAQPH